MINVRKGIKVGDFIELLKPFSDMEITFTKVSGYAGKEFDCDCGINLAGIDEVVKLEIELD